MAACLHWHAGPQRPECASGSRTLQSLKEREVFSSTTRLASIIQYSSVFMLSKKPYHQLIEVPLEKTMTLFPTPFPCACAFDLEERVSTVRQLENQSHNSRNDQHFISLCIILG